MAQGLTRGERPSWTSPGRRGGAMDGVKDSASAGRVKRAKQAAATRSSTRRATRKTGKR